MCNRFSIYSLTKREKRNIDNFLKKNTMKLKNTKKENTNGTRAVKS
jgi:hypothetical protein